MLSTCIMDLHDKCFRRRNGRRNLVLYIILILVFLILKQVAFVYRRNYWWHYDIKPWTADRTVECGGNFIGFGHQFALLRFASYDKNSKTFTIPCPGGVPSYWFYYGYQGTPYKEWMANLKGNSVMTTMAKNTKITRTPTVVVKRNEAHNIYHTMCEFYNLFLLTKIFNFRFPSIDIIFMDDRPKNVLDSTWKHMFHNISRYNEIQQNTVFQTLYWIPIGYESPINFHLLESVPYSEEFHRLFTGIFGVASIPPLDCARIRITLILRHDYISHPERKQLYGGKIQRKISNEQSLIRTLQEYLGQSHVVKSAILENMTMHEQVKLFSETDLLIGMHGAGLTHIWSLPSHAAVLELFPHHYRWRAAYYFKAFARWRKLRYVSWTNGDKSNEVDDFTTRVPESELKHEVQSILQNICPHKSF